MIAFAWLPGEGDVLLWQVDIYDTASIDGSTADGGVYTYLSQRYDNELGAVVVACDSSGNVIAPLMLVQEPEFSDIPLNDEYGALNPWQNQAIQSWMPESVTQEMLFQMYVGTYDDDWNFTPRLYSNYAPLDEINKHTHEIGQLSPIAGDWAPIDFYTVNSHPPVPEPSSGILILLGVCILGLRRKTA